MGSNDGMTWVLTVGTVGPRVMQLAENLRAGGLRVTGPTADVPSQTVGLLVVALPGSELSEAECARVEAVLANWRDKIVPVVDGPRASEAFNDLSQLIVGQLGLEEVTDRIVLLHGIGGSTMATLVRLQAKAHAWSADGRGGTGLLRGAAIDQAKRVVSSSSKFVSAETKQFVRASERARARRHRIQLIVGSVVAVLLAASSVTAVTQRHVALAAADAAHVKTNVAESDRLAGLAVELIGTDPDLPWILAFRALRISQTPEAITAARQAVEAGPAHKSILLPGLPSSMSTDPRTGTIAIRYVDGSVDIRSGTDGHLEHQWATEASSHPTQVAIAPGGAMAAIGSRLVDVVSGKSLGTLDGVFTGWVDATHMLIVKGSRLTTFDAKTRLTRQTDVTLNSPGSLAWSVAANAPIASILDGNRVISIDLRTGKALPPAAVPVKAAADIATSADGASIYVALPEGSKAFTRTASKLKPVQVHGIGRSVVAVGRSMWVVSNGLDAVQQIDQATGNRDEDFLAHRGPVTGIGALPAGHTATVGADRYLRLWAAPGVTHYDKKAGPLTIDGFEYQGPQFRTVTRPQLALSAGAVELVKTDPNHGLASLLDPTTLTVRSQAWVNMAPAISLPTVRGDAVAINIPKYVAVIDLAKRKTLWSSNALTRAAIPSIALAAIDDAGTKVALAGSTGMVVLASDGSETHVDFPARATPIWVGFEGATPTVITATGDVYRNSAVPATLPQLGSPLAGAAMKPDGTLMLVSTDGTLAELAHARLRVIARLGSDMQAFAIEPSNDGSMVAVIGAASSIIVDSLTGAVIKDLHPHSADAVIRDVAINGSTIWLLRADGGVLKQQVTSIAQLVDQLSGSLPRAQTATETASLKSVVTTIGAD